jgi:hypothetical protein
MEFNGVGCYFVIHGGLKSAGGLPGIIFVSEVGVKARQSDS